MDSEKLKERISNARARWPGVAVEDTVFCAHLVTIFARHFGSENPDPKDIERTRIDDLFLAFACAQQNPNALRYFEEHYVAELHAVWRRFRDLPIAFEDAKQRLRERLILREPPDLAAYAGQGDLRHWVRAAFLRMLLNVADRETREQPTDASFFDAVIDSEPDAEAVYWKLACRAEFEASFSVAVDQLVDRQKALLKFAYVDGRSIDEIGTIYGVHRATAARWLENARERLVGITRRELASRLKAGESEIESILRTALSGIGTTLLQRLL